MVERLRKISEWPATELPERLAQVSRHQWSLPWVGRLLVDPRITAIVAPHDHNARSVYECLRALRVVLPDRFSILSFDNYRSFKSVPVTSVDFGFGRLGYCAFHAILGLVPIMRDSGGRIRPRPLVAHRASLGPAFSGS